MLALGFLALAGAVLALAPPPANGSRRNAAVAFVAALAFAISSGPGTSDFALGQIAIVATAGLALVLALTERGAHAGFAAAATVLAGTQPNLALPLVARLRDARASASVVAGGVAFAALTLLAGGGIAGLRSYLGVLSAHGAAERVDAIQHTPAAIAYGFTASHEIAAVAGWTCAAAAVGAVVAALVRFRLGARDGTLAAIAALPFATPFFHEHDFVVVVLPLLFLGRRARGAARAWAGAAVPLALVDWFGMAQRPQGGAQIVVAGIATAALFVALRDGRNDRTVFVPFAALALGAALALPLARTVPAPVWPDALPAAYRAPAGASASVVWRDEQHAAGLDRPVAAWAFLRALPLAGCACTFIAVVLYGRTSRAPA